MSNVSDSGQDEFGSVKLYIRKWVLSSVELYQEVVNSSLAVLNCVRQ